MKNKLFVSFRLELSNKLGVVVYDLVYNFLVSFEQGHELHVIVVVDFLEFDDFQEAQK